MGRPKEHRSNGSERVPSEVIAACKAGDETAWRTFVDLTHRDVYTLCLRILSDPDDAAEATQDAYLKAWRGLKSFRGDAQLETWLYRVASNAAVSRYRSRRRRQSHETGTADELLGEMASPGSVESTAASKLEVAAVESALKELPEHYRVAVVLRDIYGLSIGEIADQMKISETAAKVRVHRGRKRLKDLMYGQGERDEV